MPNRIRSGIPAALAVLAIAAPAAVAAPVTVNVRVEAGASTLFDAPLTTDGHDVTTQAGGTHKCDSTNGNPPANPTPGPSATAALDDAARLAGFTFDGSYNDGFDDFFIERVGPDSGNPQKFWGVFVNSVSSNVGGCQQRVAPRRRGPVGLRRLRCAAASARRAGAAPPRARPCPCRSSTALTALPSRARAWAGPPREPTARRRSRSRTRGSIASRPIALTPFARTRWCSAWTRRAPTPARRPTSPRPAWPPACRARSWPASAGARAPC